MGLIYFGSALVQQFLLTSMGGTLSADVTVASTLLIAALFTPLTRRIQNDIDWRFSRKKSEARKIVHKKSGRLPGFT